MDQRLKELARTAPEHIRSHFQYRTYKKNHLILPSEGPENYFYIIESGMVEVLKDSYSGSFISVNIFEEGSFFGEIELFCPELSPYKVSAKTNCTLILVPKDTVFAWMQEEFAVTTYICETFSRRLYFTSNSMSRIAMLPLKQRILGCIHDQYLMGTLSTFTKQHLVSQTRAPIRSVNRILRDCIDSGIIEYRKKTFFVTNERELEAYAKEYEI